MTGESLGPALHALARAHRTRLGQLLAPHGLHPGQDLLLLAVWDQPGMAQKALANLLAIEPPTLTRMVQRLERGGLIERRAHPHDRRVMQVFATPRSRMIEGSVRRIWTMLDEELFAALGDVDSAKLEKLAGIAERALLKD